MSGSLKTGTHEVRRGRSRPRTTIKSTHEHTVRLERADRKCADLRIFVLYHAAILFS